MDTGGKYPDCEGGGGGGGGGGGDGGDWGAPPLRFAAAQTPYPPQAVLGGSEQPYLYPVHPYRLATVMTGGELLAVGQNTVCYNASAERQPAVGFGTGWQQGVMNVALLGLRDLAAEAVYERAATSSGDMRFPACLPNMQDFRPNEDHLSNMRSALQ